MIYGWSPKIGDPDALGWTTVAAYLAAAALCYLARRLTATSSASRPAWTALVAILLALAVNKQLDLQSAGTAIVRHLAQTNGWYGARRVAQKAFVLAVGVITLGAVLTLAIMARRLDKWATLAMTGLMLLLAFVAVRAASFHHVDALIGWRLAGIRLNHLLELGGILIISSAAAGARWAASPVGKPHVRISTYRGSARGR